LVHDLLKGVDVHEFAFSYQRSASASISEGES
jgi:hypothetical protein